MNKDLYKLLLKSIFPGLRLNRSLRILITTNSLFVFIVGLFSPFYAEFVNSIGGSVAFAGFSWALFSIVSGILILFFTRWELKVKRQELLIALGYILRAFVFLSYAFMHSLDQLIATQVLWGIAAAIGTPAFDAVYTKHTDAESSIEQWGGWEGVSSIMAGIAALVAGVIIELSGFQTIFLIMFTVCLLLGFYILWLPKETL